MRSKSVNQTVGALNANSSKTVKATDFKFDARVFRESPDNDDLLKFTERGDGQGHVIPVIFRITWRRYAFS